MPRNADMNGKIQMAAKICESCCCLKNYNVFKAFSRKLCKADNTNIYLESLWLKLPKQRHIIEMRADE